MSCRTGKFIDQPEEADQTPNSQLNFDKQPNLFDPYDYSMNYFYCENPYNAVNFSNNSSINFIPANSIANIPANSTFNFPANSIANIPANSNASLPNFSDNIEPPRVFLENPVVVDPLLNQGFKSFENNAYDKTLHVGYPRGNVKGQVSEYYTFTQPIRVGYEEYPEGCQTFSPALSSYAKCRRGKGEDPSNGFKNARRGKPPPETLPSRASPLETFDNLINMKLKTLKQTSPCAKVPSLEAPHASPNACPQSSKVSSIHLIEQWKKEREILQKLFPDSPQTMPADEGFPHVAPRKRRLDYGGGEL